MSSRSLLSVFTLLAVFGTTLSNAQAQRRDDDSQARELFIEGEAHYAAGRYEQAAKNYEEAYELSQRPELLFNIGNAYERMGDYEKAADYLRRYVDSPRARDVVSVRERIRRLETAAEEQRKAEEARKQVEAAETITTPPPVASTPEPSTTDPAIWWFAGSGAAAVTTVVFAVLSNNAGSDAEADCASTSTGATLCDQDASDALSQETVFAIATDISAITTIATAGVGLYLLLTSDTENNAPDAVTSLRTTVTPTVTPSGVGVSVSGRF